MSSPSVDRNLQKAKNLVRKGQTYEAYQLYSAVVEKHPDNKQALHALNKLQQAGPRKEQINNLVTLYQQGQFQQALQLGLELTRCFPENFFILNIIGVVYSSLGYLEDAVATFNKVLQIKPDSPDVHNNLGKVFKLLGRNKDAATCYSEALQLRPGHYETQYHLGNTFMSLGRYEEAVTCYKKLLQSRPDEAHVHNDLGAAFVQLDRYDEAIAYFTRALQLKPDYALARNNLFVQYEKANKLAEFKDVIEQAKATLPDDDNDIQYFQGLLANRENRLDDACIYLERVVPSQLHSNLQHSHAELLGKTYDKLNMHDKAFSQFELMNNLVSESVSARDFDAQRYFNNVLHISDSWSAAPSPAWSLPHHNDSSSLAFLVGFPRSGTTLLDTILRSHPRVAVIEEIPMIPRMMAHLNISGTYEETINLNANQLTSLREVYVEELNRHLNNTDYELVIDKMPLNINHVGLIHRVFPEAKFILALRHPCDCVLSCFMQNFKLNDAMTNFLNLEQSARYYDAVMHLWKIYNEHLELPVGVLKYEELVNDLKGSAEPLLNFLDLEWHENLEKYQETAISRDRIKTPSYNQVTQGIYTQASYRWRNYIKHMEPVIPLLEPWARHFDY